MRAQWEAERQAMRRVQELREELEQVRHEAEEAERSLRPQPRRRAALRPARRAGAAPAGRGGSGWRPSRASSRLLREVVTEEEIAEIVSRWTGIPVTRLQEGEREKLLRLDEILHERVVGQDEAVQAGRRRHHPGPVRASRTRAGRSARSSSSARPASGKTELARTLAAALFDTEENMVRHRHERVPGAAHRVSRLVGAPPGYVGYEEGGQLTEAVRRKPYSVVLFDEIEKAHADVFNTLLQVLDDGRLTDAQGRTVDFRNTVIIMTSNIGSQYLLDGVTADGEIKPEARDLVMAELRGHFRPEFLNRVDDIVLFKPLTPAEIERIVDLHASTTCARGWPTAA